MTRDIKRHGTSHLLSGIAITRSNNNTEERETEKANQKQEKKISKIPLLKFYTQYPFLFFSIVVTICLGATGYTLYSTLTKETSLFTPEKNMYDPMDKLSIQTDSLRLAVENTRTPLPPHTQEQLLISIAYEYIAELGLFSLKGATDMKLAEKQITSQPNYENYCVRKVGSVDPDLPPMPTSTPPPGTTPAPPAPPPPAPAPASRRALPTRLPQIQRARRVEPLSGTTAIPTGTTQLSGTTPAPAAAPASSVCAPVYSPTLFLFPRKWESIVAWRLVTAVDDKETVELYNKIMPCTVSLDAPQLPVPACNLLADDSYDGLWTPNYANPACEAVVDDITAEDTVTVCNLRLLVEEVWSWCDGSADVPAQDLKQVGDVLQAMYRLKTEKFRVAYFMDSERGIISTHSRAVIPVLETASEKEPPVRDWLFNDTYPLSEKIHETSLKSPMYSSFYIRDIMHDITERLILDDCILILASIAAVFVYAVIVTGSLFIPAVSVLQGGFAVPFAFIICQEVLRITFFPYYISLAFFLSLMVSSSTTFTLTYFYRQSRHHMQKYPAPLPASEKTTSTSLAKQFSWIIRQTVWNVSCHVLLITSIFLCMLHFPFPHVRAFSIFMAIVTATNFILAFSLFVTALIISERYLERKDRDGGRKRQWDFDYVVQKLLHQNMTLLVSSVVFRLFLFALVLGSSVYLTLQIIQVDTATRLLPYIPTDHPAQRNLNSSTSNFPYQKTNEKLKLYLTVGISDVNRAGVDFLYTPELLGKVYYDPAFEMTETCDFTLKQLCAELQNSDATPVSNDTKWAQDFRWLFSKDVMGRHQVACNFHPDPQDPQQQLGVALGEAGEQGGKIVFASISGVSSELLAETESNSTVTKTHFDAFQKMQNTTAKYLKHSCGIGANASIMAVDLDHRFTHMRSREIQYERLWACIYTIIPITAVLFFASTASLLLTIAGLICTGLCVVNVFGILALFEWTLGTEQTLACVLLFGICAQFILYTLSEYTKQAGPVAEKLKKTYKDSGIVSTHTAFAVALLGVPMIFCKITFFKTFGLCLMVASGVSWFFANAVCLSLVASFALDSRPDPKAAKGQPEERQGLLMQENNIPLERRTGNNEIQSDFGFQDGNMK
jgi:hypothetical protein